MPNKYVDFVTDEKFEECVMHVCKEFENTGNIDDEKLQKNGIDPIKMTFDMIKGKMNFKEWRKKESERQDDKSVNNAIGEFHQMLLGGVSGWTDLGIGSESHLDLQKNDDSIFMEIKNKENTVNSGSLQNVRDKLEKQSEKKPDALCYWAYVSAKNGKSEEKEWKGENENPNIRRLSGSKIYEVVTGDAKNLEKVWMALRLAIKNVCNSNFTSTEPDKEIFKTWFKKAYNKPKKSRKTKSSNKP
ncbi:MAG: Eco47II family restriction endonuclease [bacterium]|nr:Eco47II family restriction endonuclease [bacterium]